MWSTPYASCYTFTHLLSLHDGGKQAQEASIKSTDMEF